MEAHAPRHSTCKAQYKQHTGQLPPPVPTLFTQHMKQHDQTVLNMYLLSTFPTKTKIFISFLVLCLTEACVTCKLTINFRLAHLFYTECDTNSYNLDSPALLGSLPVFLLCGGM